MNTIYVLWLRQLKRYVRSRARMVSSLGQPLLFLLALGFGFGPIYQKAGGGDYLQFITPGIIAMSILFTAMFTGVEIIWDRQFGFLKETLVAPVSRLSIMLGRTLGGATVSTMQGIIVFLVALIAGFRPISLMLLPVAFVFSFLIAVLFSALGSILGSFLEDMQAFPIIINFIMMPLFFISGALFPLTGLPTAIRVIASFDPLSYGVDGLRGTLVNGFYFGFSTDLGVLLLLTALLLAIGSYAFSKMRG